jgi:hypothetical protein
MIYIVDDKENEWNMRSYVAQLIPWLLHRGVFSVASLFHMENISKSLFFSL